MFINFFCLCPLGLGIEMNFTDSESGLFDGIKITSVCIHFKMYYVLNLLV